MYLWITSHWNWSNHLGPGQDKKAEEVERRWEEKRKDEKWEIRRKKRESPEFLLPMRLWMLFISPTFILS